MGAVRSSARRHAVAADSRPLPDSTATVRPLIAAAVVTLGVPSSTPPPPDRGDARRAWVAPGSSCRIAGVDREHGPRDALRPIAEQELDGVCYVVDVGQTAQRAAPGDLFPFRVFEPLRHLGVHEAG